MCISVLIVICYLTIREKHMQHFRKVHVHIISVLPGKNRFLPVLFLGKGKKGRKSFVYLLSNSLKTTYYSCCSPYIRCISWFLLSSIYKPTQRVSSNLCVSRNKIHWCFFLYLLRVRDETSFMLSLQKSES